MKATKELQKLLPAESAPDNRGHMIEDLTAENNSGDVDGGSGCAHSRAHAGKNVGACEGQALF